MIGVGVETGSCPSSFWWSTEAIRTHCQRDIGHAGDHTEHRNGTLYKWKDVPLIPEGKGIIFIPNQRLAS